MDQPEPSRRVEHEAVAGPAPWGETQPVHSTAGDRRGLRPSRSIRRCAIPLGQNTVTHPPAREHCHPLGARPVLPAGSCDAGLATSKVVLS